MKQSLEQITHVYLIGFLAAFLVACESGQESEKQITLNRGINGDPEILDPQLYRSTQAGHVLRDIGEGLIQYDIDGSIVGGVAESWQVTKSGLSYVFQIRDGAKWSNGRPVTAQDFVVAFRRLVDPNVGSPSAQNLSSVRNFLSVVNGSIDVSELGVFADSRTQFRIELEEPVPYFLHLLAHPSLFPACSACESVDIFSQSNGAYKLQEWQPSSAISLSRNQHYWDNDATYFDRVVYHVADPAVEVDRFRSGELDITSNIDPSKYRLMEQIRPEAIRISPYLGVYYYGFNLEREPYKSNRHLRAALSLAIDREAIAGAVLGRGEVPAFSFVPPNVDSYQSQEISMSGMTSQERTKKAQQLFREAGYSGQEPLVVELRINTLGGHSNIAAAVRSMWKDVLGVETIIIAEEFRVLISNIQDRKVTEVFRLSWTGDYNDAQSFLQLFVSDNPNNLTGYSNSAVDTLLQQAAVASGTDSRRKLLQRAESIALGDHPVIPIYFFVSKHLVREDIDGWVPNVMDLHPSKYLRKAAD